MHMMRLHVINPDGSAGEPILIRPCDIKSVAPASYGRGSLVGTLGGPESVTHIVHEKTSEIEALIDKANDAGQWGGPRRLHQMSGIIASAGLWIEFGFEVNSDGVFCPVTRPGLIKVLIQAADEVGMSRPGDEILIRAININNKPKGPSEAMQIADMMETAASKNLEAARINAEIRKGDSGA